MISKIVFGFAVLAFTCFIPIQINAQTTAFSYQGSLNNGASPANGNYDFEFVLFDAVSGGAQIGSTVTVTSVAVTNGIFSVNLNFGSQFPGANRFLEIRVRQTGGGSYTTLAPRNQVNSSPYSVKSLTADTATSATNATNAANATNATTATTATNATQLGGVAANQYVLTGDVRLSDARNPLPNSANYIQNSLAIQAGSNFNVSGTGNANIFNAATQFNIGGSRILSRPGTNNLFLGTGTGSANTSGSSNSFFGTTAGTGNTTGIENSFFGNSAGNANQAGNQNTFVGHFAGRLNTSHSNTFVGAFSGDTNTVGGFNTFLGYASGNVNVSGNRNVFLGVTAGRDNIGGSDNTFVGGATGQANQSGNDNSMFGSVAGTGNTTGSNNSFFGRGAGNINVAGTFNSAFGSGANVASGNLSYATAIGAGVTATTSNSVVVGRNLDTVTIPGTLTANGSGVTNMNASNIATGNLDPARLNNAVILNSLILQPTSNFNISGNGEARGTLSGNVVNSVTQYQIGFDRVLGVAGGNNLFVGKNTGSSGHENSFIGSQSGFNNTTGSNNSFAGAYSGSLNTMGTDNAFFGTYSGYGNALGGSNSFFGAYAGLSNTTGNSNSLFGNIANVASANLTNATAIGARALVSQSNSLVLGSIDGVNNATADTNVGIGTTSPQYKLHVVGENIRVQGNATTVLPRFSLNFTGGGTDQKKWQNYASTNSLLFTALNDAENSETGWLQVNRGTGTSISSIILPNGNVGIGTFTPQGRLDVRGDVFVGLTNGPNGGGPNSLYIANDSGDVFNHLRLDGAGNALHIVARSSSGSQNGTGIVFRTAPAGAGEIDRVSIDQNGLMAIINLGSAGTTALCRNGSNQISTCSSSARYKNNIQSFTPGLDLVRRLRPVSFNWKDGNLADMGLVAEEVNAIEPLLTTTNEKGEVEGVKYDRVGVVLVNAVNEQQNQIEVQQKLNDIQQEQIEAQQKLIESQQRQIDELKQLVCQSNPTAAFCKK